MHADHATHPGWNNDIAGSLSAGVRSQERGARSQERGVRSQLTYRTWTFNQKPI